MSVYEERAAWAGGLTAPRKGPGAIRLNLLLEWFSDGAKMAGLRVSGH